MSDNEPTKNSARKVKSFVQHVRCFYQRTVRVDLSRSKLPSIIQVLVIDVF